MVLKSASLTSNEHAQKRKSSSARLTTNAIGRAVKRRAPKACQFCRARKVRCDLVEHGNPCTNCRLDEVPCVVTKDKRMRKSALEIFNFSHSRSSPQMNVPNLSNAEAFASSSVNLTHSMNSTSGRYSDFSGFINEAEDPHTLHQKQTSLDNISRNYVHTQSSIQFDVSSQISITSIHGDPVLDTFAPILAPEQSSQGPLPQYIKQLPNRLSADDIQYLQGRGALEVPDTTFRNELIRCYVEFVHPYMPIVDLAEFVHIIDDNHGETGKISLLLLQAVMFAGTAFIDMVYLEAGSFTTRRSARKAFYHRARALYDFDYEMDQVTLVQSLLLMTYWHESPGNQKEAWHWMGEAISLAHTIGLNINPEKSKVDLHNQKFWKRIWWSCFMRDRLVALGTRRPPRIKEEDCDVPMLTMNDFDIEVLNSDCLANCSTATNLSKQRDLALLCIAKAKLSLCVGHILSTQYFVLVRDQGMSHGQEGNTISNAALIPRKLDHNDAAKLCNAELANWLNDLPSQLQYNMITQEMLGQVGGSFVVQRALLHMLYFATLSTLHRPQVLSLVDNATIPNSCELQDLSRTRIREASREITRISCNLYQFHLERYLPTTGVTALLPAIFIHILDIKSASNAVRDVALQGFCNCMQVLTNLTDNYASADFAIQLLETAIRTADIAFAMNTKTEDPDTVRPEEGRGLKPQTTTNIVQNNFQLVDAGLPAQLTPTPEFLYSRPLTPNIDLSNIRNQFSDAITPPHSETFPYNNENTITSFEKKWEEADMGYLSDHSFSALFNFEGFDDGADWVAGEEAHGQSGEFAIDLNRMNEAHHTH